MQVIDLFSGIGGFSLAAHWAGWQTIQFCEIDKFCQRVLSHHFPNVPIHGDIKTLNYEEIKSRIERTNPTIIVGGFPCQPFSSAGKRKGTEDERHLWPEMLRAIREIKPTWVVGENVRGLVSWSNGLVFEQVQADMEAEGYEVQSFILPACGKNAPHRRDRVWIVAHAVSDGHESGRFNQDRSAQKTCEAIEEERERVWNDVRGVGESGVTSDTENIELQHTGQARKRRSGFEDSDKRDEITPDTQRIRQQGSGFDKQPIGSEAAANWKASWSYDDGRWPTVAPVCSGNDGIPGRLVDITFSKWRKESLKALGNAIVPQVAYQIFQAINEYEQLNRTI